MNQQARFLLAITLMILVLVTTNIIFPPPPVLELQPEVSDSVGLGDGLLDRAPTLPGIAETPPAVAPEVAGPKADTSISGFDPASVEAAREVTVTVEGPLYEFAFSNRGARLTSAVLPQFESFASEGRVQLLPQDGPGALGMAIEMNGRELDLRDVPFEVVPEQGLRLGEGGGPRVLTFRYEHPSGALTVQTEYTFDPSSYVIDVRTEVFGADRAQLFTDMGTGLEYNEGRQADESRVMAYVTNHLQQGIQAERLAKVDREQVVQGPFIWSVLKSKYFMFAFMPGAEGQERYLGGLIARPALGDDRAEVTVTQPLGSDGRVDYRLFLGPQDFDLLTSFDNDLQDANPYGWRWMRPMIRPVVGIVMSILNFLHDNLNLGYGWVLIVFGVVMRVLLFPLNQKAMRAQMRNMAVQPLLQEIQTKYKDQPEKLQKEMMKLYKEHGFNPLAGCLPMLLPWPVLITLFFVFQNTIQLRGESFLWLPNLSAADPLYILPLLLGVSMFLMQWISIRSMPTPNPQMKMMMWMMPPMMTFIFINFASGLNLYYVTANLATLPQQYWIAKERQKLQAKGPLKPATSGD